MQPGYRKKVKFVKNHRKDLGFVNLSQVTDKIVEMNNSEEFYEIEPAVVEKVYLDFYNDDDFPTVFDSGTNKEKPDLSYLGCIKVRLLHSQSRGGSIDLVKPLSRHIVQYPIRGEVVNVANYNGALYYSNPLSLNNDIDMNKMDTTKSEGVVIKRRIETNRKLYAEQGDTVLQGRFGQSIKFGSDDNFAKSNIKITAGQSTHEEYILKKYTDLNYPHPLDINLDDASIYITTNEHIPLKTDAKSQVKTEYLGERFKSVIAMNADSIVFNTKNNGDISSYASRHLTLAARTSINLESEFGEINLGDVDSVNPAVKGKELEVFLDDVILSLRQYSNNISSFLKSQQSRSQKENEGQKKQINQFTGDFKTALDGLEQRLGENADFFSRRVFVADDHNRTVENSVWEDEEWEKRKGKLEKESPGVF